LFTLPVLLLLLLLQGLISLNERSSIQPTSPWAGGMTHALHADAVTE